MDQSLSRRRNVEQKLRVASYRREIELDQFVHRPHPVILGPVVEPPRTDRHVGLARAPHRAERIAVLQHLGDTIARRARARHDRRVHGGPVGIARLTPARCRSSARRARRPRRSPRRAATAARGPSSGASRSTCRRPFGPSPFAPSNHTSWIGPYRVEQFRELVAIEIHRSGASLRSSARSGPRATGTARLSTPRPGRRRRTRAPRRRLRRATGSTATECRVVFVGHRQNPSWCLAVSTMARKPASRAVRAHWRASSRDGAKIAGSSVPSPHSRSVNVLTPKWRNIASSSRCHASWDGVGTGRRGPGDSGSRQQRIGRFTASRRQRRPRPWSETRGDRCPCRDPATRSTSRMLVIICSAFVFAGFSSRDRSYARIASSSSPIVMYTSPRLSQVLNASGNTRVFSSNTSTACPVQVAPHQRVSGVVDLGLDRAGLVRCARVLDASSATADCRSSRSATALPTATSVLSSPSSSANSSSARSLRPPAAAAIAAARIEVTSAIPANDAVGVRHRNVALVAVLFVQRAVFLQVELERACDGSESRPGGHRRRVIWTVVTAGRPRGGAGKSHSPTNSTRSRFRNPGNHRIRA